jgi:hypothetical protein
VLSTTGLTWSADSSPDLHIPVQLSLTIGMFILLLGVGLKNLEFFYLEYFYSSPGTLTGIKARPGGFPLADGFNSFKFDEFQSFKLPKLVRVSLLGAL